MAEQGGDRSSAEDVEDENTPIPVTAVDVNVQNEDETMNTRRSLSNRRVRRTQSLNTVESNRKLQREIDIKFQLDISRNLGDLKQLTDSQRDAFLRFGTTNVSVIESYLKALEEGKEKSISIRVMIVGHFGAGKTTVTRKLLGLPLNEIQSTNGIDIHVHKCLVSKDGSWTKQNVEDLETEHMERYVSVALDMEKSTQSADNTFEEQSTQSADNTLIKKSNSQSKQSAKIETFSSLPRKTDKDVNEFIKLRERKQQPQLKIDKSKTMNIWDFGGQWIFYATHQLFHSPNAIYLLVLDVSKNFEDMVVDEEFPGESSQKDVKSFCKFWMHSIHSFVGQPNSKPPVILVGTHMDMVHGDEVVFKYFDGVRELFNETPILQHIQSKNFLIDNATTDDQLNKLRDYIVSIADTDAKEVPAKWILLQNSMMRRIDSNYITFEDVATLGKDYQINETEDIVAFLMYQNAQGTFFYFNEPVLSTCVVLNPQWIIDALKCIITSERFCKNMPSLRQPWNELMQKAILRPALIEQVWQNDGENDFMIHRDILIQYMTKFGIVTKAKRYDETTEICQELDFFFVPSLLRYRSTHEDAYAFTRGKTSTTTSLVFSFENESVSTTLYHRMTAAALDMWHVIYDGKKYLLFEDVGVYRLDSNHAGIIEVTDQTIEIRVVSMLREDSGIDCQHSDKLRRFVEIGLKHELCRFRATEDQYTIRSRCAIEDKGSRYIIEMDEMENNTSIACPNLGHNHDIDVKTVMRQWYPHKVSKTEERKSIMGCYDITRLRQTISEKDLSRIANQIGKNWELLASSLGIPQVTCEQIQMTYPYSSVLQILKMLVKWSQEKCEDATFEVLLREMESTMLVTIDWDGMKNILDNFEW